MRHLQSLLAQLLGRVARGSRPPGVLILGETGTGKGVVARLLHRMSSRAQAPFVDINCAALPETLMEAELFGFERGAFTDARHGKPGLFQMAHRGTLFLDEVALLPLALQAKLLTVFEERAVRRLGATEKEPADAWVISATNVDLTREGRGACFREDLYHRLAVMTVRMPPLRERREDIDLLADYFLDRARADYGLPPLGFAPDARERLRAHSWPGNVRELANAVERAALLGDRPLLTAASFDLVEYRRAGAPTAIAGVPGHPTARASRDDMQREHLHQVLSENGWNISRVARILGVTRNTVRAHIRKFRLRVDAGLPISPSSSSGLIRWNGASLPSGL